MAFEVNNALGGSIRCKIVTIIDKNINKQLVCTIKIPVFINAEKNLRQIPRLQFQKPYWDLLEATL